MLLWKLPSTEPMTEIPELQVSARRLAPKEQEPLFQRLFHVKVRSVAGSRGSAAGKHRPSSCASLMARSFRFHGRLCLLCGCFFIRNLFGRLDQQRPPKVVWKSWYTLYSSGCIMFLCWTVVDDIVYNGYRAARSRHALDSSLRAVANAVALVKIIVNLMCLLRGSSRIIDFYVRSAAFERRVGMPSCECCAPRRYFWSDVRRACLCVVYCAAFGVAAFLSPQAIESTIGRGNDNGWIDACFWISFMVTSVFYFAYDNVHTVALRSSCEVLVEYVKVQLRVLEECLALGANEQTLSPGRDDDVPARLESVRLNLCEIQRLKNAINDVWNWSLVVNGVFVLLLLCTAVYDLCTDGLGGSRELRKLVLRGVHDLRICLAHVSEPESIKHDGGCDNHVHGDIAADRPEFVETTAAELYPETCSQYHCITGNRLTCLNLPQSIGCTQPLISEVTALTKTFTPWKAMVDIVRLSLNP
ncbi:hypothetical protein MTO96_022338 [Rhipicephalus appendiculatus]